MKRNGFNLRELFTVLMIIAVLCMVLVPAIASGDRGPQAQATTVTTNSANATLAIPLGDTGSFTPMWIVISGFPASTTQALSYVSGVYTGSVTSVTASGVIAISNLPVFFSGDKFLIPTSGLGTNTYTATVIGRVFD